MKCNDVDKIKPLDKLLDEKVKEFESGEDKRGLVMAFISIDTQSSGSAARVLSILVLTHQTIPVYLDNSFKRQMLPHSNFVFSEGNGIM